MLDCSTGAHPSKIEPLQDSTHKNRALTKVAPLPIFGVPTLGALGMYCFLGFDDSVDPRALSNPFDDNND